MARAELPSYTELVYEVLQAAPQPLTFDEVFQQVERRRPVATRNPKSTIRNALGQGSQLVNVGDGRYWYLPHCLRGSLLRIVFTEKKTANHPIRLADEVRHALWPACFEGGKRRDERPMRLHLPSGDVATLRIDSHLVPGWNVPMDEALRRHLLAERVSAGDALLVRIDDAQAGQGEAWFESRHRRPENSIAARNREMADAAAAWMRRPSTGSATIWDLAVALLARGVYQAPVAPDPLRDVLRADARFEFPRMRGWLGTLTADIETFVNLREVADVAILPAPSMLYQIKVTLRGTSPPIWRRLIVPANTRLSKLHDILQVAMGWSDSHLHQFQVGRREIGVPSPDDWRDVEDERKLTLAEVAPREKARLRYEYDFGDGWEHEIVVEKLLPAGGQVRTPTCVGGKRACPPEDVGGIWGYAEFLEVMADPSHPEHNERLEWFGEEFDPEAFDLDAVNATLRRLR